MPTDRLALMISACSALHGIPEGELRPWFLDAYRMGRADRDAKPVVVPKELAEEIRTFLDEAKRKIELTT
jgi:hypothetical protein